MASIKEQVIEPELLEQIHGAAREAAKLLGVGEEWVEQDVIEAIDEFIFAWQKGTKPEAVDDEDLAKLVGSLWGQQLVSKLGWQWSCVNFLEHDNAKAVGVFSPDRSLAIYPFHFVHGCIENNASVTILLSFNMLVDGSRIPDLPANGYENVMDNVHHIVPRS